MNLRSVAAALALGSVMLVPAGAQAAAQVDIRDVDVAGFPQVRLTVSVAGDHSVGPDGLTVLEDGSLVEGLEISSLEEEGVGVDVILALDTSGSMQGEPLAAALEAADAFLDGLPDNVRIGVVTFSDSAKVAQRPTSDHEAASDALRNLSAKGETALYDAVERAAGLFSGDAQRNIVLLSDGGDTASRITLEKAAAAAADAGATVFPVGLRSGEADIQALRSLAKETGGRYSSAATADLSTVYEGLATELGGQFVVEYTSGVAGGEEFSVVVRTPRGSDEALVLAPSVGTARQPAPPVADRVSDPLLEGTAGLIVVLVLCFGATFMVALLYLGKRAGDRREQRLRKLVEVEAPTGRGPEPEDRSSWVPSSMIRLGERWTAGEEKSKALDRRIERAGWSFRPGEFVGMVATLSIVGFFLGVLLVQNLIMGLVIAGLAAYSPYLMMGIATRRRSAALQAQLPDILMILASSLRAGHSFLQALDSVAREIGAPGSQEFNRVVAEVRLGRSVTDSLNDLAERVGSEDFEWAVMAVNVQRDVGGNLAEVLDTVASTMRERERVRGQVKVLSAEGRLSIGILTALPFVVAIYMILVRPDYIGLLVTTRIGVVMSTVSASLMVLGFLWMKKVVKVDV